MRWDGKAWNQVQDPSSGTLYSVSMDSPDDGWAVGAYEDDCTSYGSVEGTLMHWNGSAWDWGTDSVDNISFRSVAMLSATDGWAVGYQCIRTKLNNIPMANGESVIMHWDGSSWNVVNNDAPFTIDTLNSVAMLSATDGWAVGRAAGIGAILHWDGHTWSPVSSPTPCGLNSVAMVSADDGWAVGGKNIWSTCSQTSVLLHWNGKVWSEIVSPVSAQLSSVTMVSPDEGWAVGDAGVILHYTNFKNLSINKTGAGTGTVTSNPAGIDCGTNCSYSFDNNLSVTLTAKADTGSSFTGWSDNGCSGTGTCTVTMSAARSVTANFISTPTSTYRIYLPLAIR